MKTGCYITKPNERRLDYPLRPDSFIIYRWFSTKNLALYTLIMSFLLAMFSVESLAQSYQVGYAKYTKGDLKGAETSLKAALKKNPVANEKVKDLKLLGIVQYSLGNKNGASACFKAALKLNPGLTVKSDEVLDESVLGLFNSIKAKYAANSQKKPAAAKSSGKEQAKQNQPPQKAPGKPVKGGKEPQPKQAAGASVTQKTLPAKSTSLLIKSNVPSASITMDGILAGSVGSPIEVDAGTVQIELSAPGYQKKFVKVKIAGKSANEVTINLAKIPPPKPKPAPVPAPLPKQVAKAPTKSSKLPQKAPSKSASGKKGASGKSPANGGDMFLPDPGVDAVGDLGGEYGPEMAGAGGYQPQPQAQPVPQQSMPQQQVAPPAYYQQQPPVYYQQPPVYYQPAPPVYYQPAPPVYQQPTYVQPPAPPPPPDSSAPPTYDTGGAYDLPPPATSPVGPSKGGGKSSKKTSGKKGDSSDKSYFVAMLPLGAGQFQNDNILLGIGFAAAEIGGGVMTFLKYKEYTDYKAYADAKVAEQSANVKTAQENGEISDAEAEQKIKEINQYAVDSTNYCKGLQQTALIYGGLTAAVYVAGVIEAFISFDDKPVKKKKAKKYAFDLDLPKGIDGIYDDELIALEPQPSLYNELLPNIRPTLLPDEKGQRPPVLSLSLEWSL